jgi:NAD(P)-dependent dehydrogenase (short-subunit alcohol dehydrogenase family)
MDLLGKTILVTGAARGLGQKMAELIANQGANLALADVDHEELKETVRLCSKDGNKVKYYAADVIQESSVEQLFRNIQHNLGGVDGCINNAGEAPPRARPSNRGDRRDLFDAAGRIKRGAVTLCIGGGQGIALALESLR